MRMTDDGGNPYTMLGFSASEFAVLKTAVAELAPDLRLDRTRLDDGRFFITVMAPRSPEIASSITRTAASPQAGTAVRLCHRRPAACRVSRV